MSSRKPKLTRSIDFTPAFDRRDKDPNKNYGIHGVDLLFHLKGPKGAVTLVVYTNWHLPHVTEEFVNDCAKYGSSADIHAKFLPYAAELCVHHLTPCYPGHNSQPCNLNPDKICYPSFYYSDAKDYLNVLISQGQEALWTKLTELYEKELKGA